MIALFRNRWKGSVAIVQLPLIPAGRYRLSSVITGKTLGVFEPSDWARGIPVPFLDSQAVDILEVAAIKV